MVSEFLSLSIIFIVGIIFKSPWIKGIIGEYKVKSLIERRLDKKKYKIFNDVLLPTEDGTTQVDHVIISIFGIFVIETKNIKNWIFANTGTTWTQVIYKRKNKFYNPVRQNYKHVKTVESLLKCSKDIIYNTVVFSSNCEFKTDVPGGVVKLNILIPFIKSFNNEIINEDQVVEYARKIEKVRLDNTLYNKIKHINHVNDILIDKGYAVGIINKTLKIYAYKIILTLIFILILFSMLGKISKQSSEILSNITKKNIEQRNYTKQKDSEEYNSTIQKEKKVSEESRNITSKKSATNRNPIYSWTNEKGQRVFSNVGFPTNKQYTDPKIEWY